MTSGTSPDTPRRDGHKFAAPLRYRDFRLFWTGLLLSGFGSNFTQVAMAWQIYELTNSPLHLGFLGLSRAIPQVGLLLLGGLLADAMDRRRLMMFTQVGLFCVSAALAVLTAAGMATPLMLYVATIFLALFSSLESPARNSLVPNLVPAEQLAPAMALHNAARFGSAIAGPALAGVVLAVSGAALCYWVDALSWVAMLVALALMRTKVQEGQGWKTVSFGSLVEGLVFVVKNKVIFPLMLLDFSATFFGTVRAMLPIYARDILLVGPQGLGALYSAMAAGSILAAGGMSVVGEVRRAGFWILASIGLYGTCVVLFSGSRIFWLSLLLLAGYGAGDMVSTVLRATISQLATPDELRGRMTSIKSVFTNSGPQLGQFQSGLVAAWLGAQLSLLIGGLATLVFLAGVAVSFPKVRGFRIQDSGPPRDGTGK